VKFPRSGLDLTKSPGLIKKPQEIKNSGDPVIAASIPKRANHLLQSMLPPAPRSAKKTADQPTDFLFFSNMQLNQNNNIGRPEADNVLIQPYQGIYLGFTNTSESELLLCLVRADSVDRAGAIIKARAAACGQNYLFTLSVPPIIAVAAAFAKTAKPDGFAPIVIPKFRI
jgi:hypothetical protein